MVIAFPHPPGSGGPGSFQSRFELALKAIGWNIVYAKDNITPDVVMVVGGTQKLAWLYRMKRRGIPIIHRLDGINWLHRVQRVSWKKWLMNEARNWMTRFIWKNLADVIIYQSNFVKEWWAENGQTTAKEYVINNGVDLNVFAPRSGKAASSINLLCLEGHLDYSPYAIDLMNALSIRLSEEKILDGIIVYGGFQDISQQYILVGKINYRGKLARNELPKAYKNAIYLSLDVNAACPNTVSEALASGIPVVGFATGALPELVTENSGIVVPYGSDPWQLGFPDVDALVAAIRKIKSNWQQYSEGARAVAVERYDLNKITEKYLAVIKQYVRTE